MAMWKRLDSQYWYSPETLLSSLTKFPTEGNPPAGLRASCDRRLIEEIELRLRDT